MVSPGKESADPNIQPSALRKRDTPDATSSEKARRQKRRMSMRNRRVSFAPDPELTMIHTFEKEDEASPGQPSPVFYKITEEEETLQDTKENRVQSPRIESPTMIDMDITQATRGYMLEGKDKTSPEAMAFRRTADITAAVPTLGELALADETEDDLVGLESGVIEEKQEGSVGDNITAAVPRLGDLLAEEAEDEPQPASQGGMDDHRLDEDMEITMGINPNFEAQEKTGVAHSPVRSAAQHRRLSMASQQLEASSPAVSTGARVKGQEGKWGFVPGTDDTMDIDLKDHGRMIMGDTTYVGVYADMTTAHTTMIRRKTDGYDEALNSKPGHGMLAQKKTEIYDEKSDADVVVGKLGEEGKVKACQKDKDDASVEIGAGDDVQDKSVPDWTAPAFLPPFTGDVNNDPDHPALYTSSPEITNSSINTLSTRRVSVGLEPRQAGESVVISNAQDHFIDGDDEGTSKILESSPGKHDQQQDIPDDCIDASYKHDGDRSQDSPEAWHQQDESAQHVMQEDAEDKDLLEQSDDTGDLLADDDVASPGIAHGSADVGAPRSLLNDEHQVPSAVDVDVADANISRPLSQTTHGTTKMLQDDFTGLSDHGDGFTGDIMPTPLVDGFSRSDIKLGQTLASHQNPANGVLSMKMTNSPPPSAMSMGSMRRTGVVSPGISQQQGSSNHIREIHLRNSAAKHTHTHLHMAPLPENSTSVVGTTPLSVHRLGTPGDKIGGQALVPSMATSGGGRFAMGSSGMMAMTSSTLPPGSAIAARYPGSAVATGRLSQGYTPSAAPPITFQDFAKIVEVQFLDNLRRGASINYADLQPNPLPKSLTEAYALLCVTGPNVSELETAIHTLQTETSRLRANASELEVMLGQTNPPIFRHVQTASSDQLDAFRENIQLLKKVCRSKATAILKDVRCQMEDSKARRLARAVEGLRGDLVQVLECSQHIRGVAEAVSKFAKESRERLQKEARHRIEEGERRRQLAASRSALAEIRASNEIRRQRLSEAINKIERLDESRQALEKERIVAEKSSIELKHALDKASKLVARHRYSDVPSMNPREVLSKLRKVAALERILGVNLRQARLDALILQVGPSMRLQVSRCHKGVCGTLDVCDVHTGVLSRDDGALGLSLMPPAEIPQDNGRNISEVTSRQLFVVDPINVPTAVQHTIATLQQCSQIAKELCGVCCSCPHLIHVRMRHTTPPVEARDLELYSLAWHGVTVLFSGFEMGVRFEVTLFPTAAYPFGPLPHDVKIWYDGHGQVTKESISNAVKGVSASPGRLRAVCKALSVLVESVAPVPAQQTASTFVSNFGNPLFGAVGGGSDVKAHA